MDVLAVPDLGTLAGATIVVALVVEIILRAWAPDHVTLDRFGPLVAVAVGILVVTLFGVSQNANLVNSILTGLFAGSSAIGLQNVVTQSVITPSSPA